MLLSQNFHIPKYTIFGKVKNLAPFTNFKKNLRESLKSSHIGVAPPATGAEYVHSVTYGLLIYALSLQ